MKLKVPPLVVVVIVAVVMGLVATVVPGLTVRPAARWLLLGLVAGAGICCVAAGILHFARAKTTVNPTRPETTSSLVSTGIYAYSRNPMYLGFLLLLIGWGLYLANLVSLGLCVVFVLYMNRYQIVPEENALANRFGDDFVRYKQQVRRWL